MTALKDRILRLIEATGPISIADYMALCLFDPQHGYYATREPFGAAGDFTTAPEISQMFGELIAVWIYGVWIASGRPAAVTVAEIGPGRGVLMKDVLRTLAKLDRSFVAATNFALVETSPRLTEIQQQTLKDAQAAPEWRSSVAALADQPLIIVGNELFDAIPIRQYVRTAEGWRERMVGIGEDGGLALALGAGMLDPALLPPDASSAPEGAVFEVSPAREALMTEIADRIARTGGSGLFIDYGHAQSAVGDTFQAVRRHAFDPVLAHPGEADLTSHVDFEALARAARAAALDTALLTQGEFLLAMGLLERAGRLGAGAGEEERRRLSQAVERLAGPEKMGKLFKILAIFPPGLRIPPFARAD